MTTIDSSINDEQETLSVRQIAKFAIPSLLGVLFFLFPFPVDGKMMPGLGIISDYFKELWGAYLPAAAALLVTISAVLSVLVRIKPFSQLSFAHIFEAKMPVVILRIVGSVFIVCTLFQVGPTAITGGATGGTILNDLLVVLVNFFFFAAIALPLLTDFGLMEFIGILVSRVFRFLFLVPGRAAIDAVASWMGSSTVGVFITVRQYESGYYTLREAATIATTFSIVSPAFCAMIISFMDLGGMFIHYYLTVSFACLVAGLILPRIWPLSHKTNTYCEGTTQPEESQHQNLSLLQNALYSASAKAANAPGPAQYFQSGARALIDIWFILLPLVMAVGTTALIIAEYTPVFQWLSYPFVPVLEFLRIPEAAQAAPTMVVGFADQFLPVILGRSIESDLTRFVVACMSATQLIYMSEIGVMILKSKMKINIAELFMIFLIRTAITLPICAAIAHLIF